MTFELAAEADYFTNGSRDIVGQEKGYQQIKDTLGKFMHDLTHLRSETRRSRNNLEDNDDEKLAESLVGKTE